MSGYNYFESPQAIRKPKLRLDYKTTADWYGGTAVATHPSWTDVAAEQMFTIESASSLVEIHVGGGMIAGSSTLSQTTYSRILVDGVAYPLGCNQGNAAGHIGNPLAGAIPLVLTGFSPGAHTLKLQVSGNSAGTNMYLRSATYPSEAIQMRVVEHVPSKAYWGGGPSQKIGSFHASRASDTVAVNTLERVDLNVEDFDSEGWFGSFRYVPLVEGYYHFDWYSSSLSTASGQYMLAYLYRNNGTLSIVGNSALSTATGQTMGSQGSDNVYADGIDDYFELWVNTSIATVTSSRLSGYLAEAV